MPELIDRVLASPGELTILAIGRQTNVALAVSIEPRFAESAAEIIVMGGSILQPGIYRRWLRRTLGAILRLRTRCIARVGA